jgi:DNA-binding CsgD family transcriptional regulator
MTGTTALADVVDLRDKMPLDVLGVEATLATVVDQLRREDFAGAREAAEEMLADVGGEAGLGGALTALALVAWHEGRVADAAGLLRAAVRRTDSDGYVLCEMYPRLGLAWLLVAVADLGSASCTLTDVRAQMLEAHDPISAAVTDVWLARLFVAEGDLDSARARATSGLDAAERVESHEIAAQAALMGAMVAMLQGDLSEAMQLFRHHWAAPPRGRFIFGSGLYLWVEAMIAEAQAGPDRAVEVLAPVYADMALHKRLLLEEPAAAPWLVRTAMAAAEGELAQTVVAVADQLASDNRMFPTVVASARHAHGVFDRDIEALRQAACGHRQPWARASAAEDAAELLATTGDADCARTDLDRARSIYTEIGATRDASRITAKLRRVDRIGGEHPARPVYGWASLTESERRVAGVVAEGLTNPQAGERLFLSRHTVDFHLRQIFRKLGIHSRVELTRVVVGLGDDA